MKKHNIIYIALAVFSASIQAEESATLCTPPETTFFSCQFSNKKIVSLCTKKIMKNHFHLIYRYGKKEHIELTYNENNSSNLFFRGTYPTNGGVENSVWFSTSKIRYVIFSRNGTYKGERYENSGIFINTKNKIRAKTCETYDEFRDQNIFNSITESKSHW